MKRPALNDNISVEEFKNYYWLKEELITFCKITGIDSSGGKIEITQRIITYLATGQIIKRIKKNNPRSNSNLDWNNFPLTLNTAITDNYKNTEHVRAFFTTQIGSHFHFSVEFMKWMKENVGKTLQAAIDEWLRLYDLKKDEKNQTEIGPQFEYNQYMRDFLKANPKLTTKDAIRFWKLKRALPGDNRYTSSDLELKENFE